MFHLSVSSLALLCAVLTSVCAAPEIPGLREVRLGPDPKTLPDLSQPVFHDRGWHFACVVEAKGRRRVYHDGVLVGPAYPQIEELTLSPDGGRVAYVGVTGNKWRVVVDGQPSPKYDGIIPNGPSFRPDGTLEWLAIKKKGLWRITVAPLPLPLTRMRAANAPQTGLVPS